MPPDGRDIFLEFTAFGNTLKATAIDPVTGQEASVIGPFTAPKADLQALAIAKLKRRLEGRKASDQTKTPPATRRGIVV